MIPRISSILSVLLSRAPKQIRIPLTETDGHLIYVFDDFETHNHRAAVRRFFVLVVKTTVEVVTAEKCNQSRLARLTRQLTGFATYTTTKPSTDSKAESAESDTSSAKPAVVESPGDVVPVGAVDVTPPVGKSSGDGDIRPPVGRKPAEAETASRQVKAIADRNRFMSCLLLRRAKPAGCVE